MKPLKDHIANIADQDLRIKLLNYAKIFGIEHNQHSTFEKAIKGFSADIWNLTDEIPHFWITLHQRAEDGLIELIKKPSQNDIILQHLEAGNTITTFQAFSWYKITRLPARIFDLRERGIKIKQETVRKGNTHFDVYRLG